MKEIIVDSNNTRVKNFNIEVVDTSHKAFKKAILENNESMKDTIREAREQRRNQI